MNKNEILASLASEHREMLLLIQHFTAQDFDRPVSPEWSVKDLFGHIAYWNAEAARAVEQVAQDERPVMMLDKDDDPINAREVQKRRRLPFQRVMEEFRTAHQAFAAVLKKTPEDELHRATRHKSGDGKDANAAWIAGGIIEHYQAHRAQLQQSLDH